MSGGSLTIRGSPSTTRVSFLNAARLSFVRAFASVRSARLTTFALTCDDRRAKMSSTSMRECQRSSVRIDANVGHRLAVGSGDREVDRPPPALAEAAVPTGHGKAGDEPP